MGKTVFTLVMMATALILASGMALGAAVDGDDQNNTVMGTSGADTLNGFGGDDMMLALGGRDVLSGGDGSDTMYGNAHADRMYGGAGADRIYGGQDNDFISSINDDGSDLVDCGPGVDTVNRMPGDTGPPDVYRNCEEAVW